MAVALGMLIAIPHPDPLPHGEGPPTVTCCAVRAQAMATVSVKKSFTSAKINCNLNVFTDDFIEIAKIQVNVGM